MNTTWAAVGTWLGEAFMVYAAFLLVACLGLHVFLLVVHGYLRARGAGRWALWILEVTYGLINPVVYLLVFQPGLFRDHAPFALVAAEWVLLAAYWGMRLLGVPNARQRGRLRPAVRAVLVAAVALIAALGLRDAALTLSSSAGFDAVPWIVLAAPLYAFPCWIAGVQFLETVDAERWAESRAFFLESRPAAMFAAVGAAASVLLVLISNVGPSERAAQAHVLQRRGAILEAARAENIDPRLLATILLITHRDQATFFRSAVENIVAHAWLTDLASHTPLARALNPSLGAMQVKPVTVLTAIWVHHASDGTRHSPSKQFRDASYETVRRIGSAAGGNLPPPAFLVPAGKKKVIEALMQDETNIRVAAYLLSLYERQWESANRDWSIRRRPDILATLFQIGFEKSYPKPDPQPNAFGRDVLAAYHSPWVQERFPSLNEPSPR